MPGSLGRLETGVLVEVVAAGDRLAVLEDLRGEGVLVPGDISHLLEERKVDVGLHVAHRPGIPVPVPRAADITRLLDQAQAPVAGLAQARPHEQTAEPAADDGDVDLVEQRVTREARLDVGVVDIVGELGGDLDVLLVAVVTDPLVPLFAVLLAQGVRIERMFSRAVRTVRAVRARHLGRHR
jgi:hypothetical protein